MSTRVNGILNSWFISSWRLCLCVWSKQDFLLACFDYCVTYCEPGDCWLFVVRIPCYFASSRWHVESVKICDGLKRQNKENGINRQMLSLFFPTSELQDLLSTILLSRAFTSQPYTHSHIIQVFFLNFSWQCVCAILALPCLVAIS